MKNTIVDFNPALIPAEMKDHKSWVCWRPEKLENGKITKIPINPHKVITSPIMGEVNAKSNDPQTWADFDTAVDAAKKRGLGLGFILSKADPFVGIDLDDCLLDGQPKSETKEMLNRFASYAEITPSGKGLHIIVKGKLAAGGQKTGNLEIYDDVRFLTMTGKPLNGKSAIRQCQSQIDSIYTKTAPEERKGLSDATRSTLTSSNVSDDTVLRDAMAFDSARFQMLFKNGDLKWHNMDHSEADMALIGLLARFTNDREQLDRLFRKSGLMREKWDVKHHGDGRTYGEGTIDAVLQNAKPLPMTSFSQYEEEEDDVSLMTLGELLTTKFPAITYIISAGIFPEGGMMILAGESGLGKSMLSIEIALHLCDGRQLFNAAFLVPKQRRIVVIQNENPIYTVQKRCQNMVDAMGMTFNEIKDRIIFVDPTALFDLGSEKSIGRIIGIIEKTKADVFLLDPLSSFHDGDENSNSDMGIILNNVIHISRVTGAGSLIVHHYGKPQQGRADEYRLRGASAIFGKADTVVAMVPKPHEHKELFTLRFDKVRHGPKPKPMLFERTPNFISIKTEDDMLVTPRQVADAVVDVFGGKCDKQTDLTQYLMNTYSITEKTARSTIKRAVELEMIRVQKTGRTSQILCNGKE